MFYMFLVWLTCMVFYDKTKKSHWLAQVLVLCTVSVMVVCLTDFIIRKCNFEETGKLISVSKIDTMDSTDYFDIDLSRGCSGVLKYSSDGKDYELTDKGGYLAFYPIPTEPECIEKYVTVYRSKLMNILVPRLRHEVFYKIYTMEILSY